MSLSLINGTIGHLKCFIKKNKNSKSNEKQNRITKAILTKTHENKSHYSWKSSEREECKTKDATVENHENERNAKK